MQTPKSGRKKAGLLSSSSSSSHQSTSRSSRSGSSHSRSLSRQSSTALPIAEPFDPTKEAVEIEALTSSVVLPLDSVPPLPSSPVASSRAGSTIGTPRLRYETFHTKVDYRHDGDRWMDTDVMMAKRRKLKQEEDILRWVNVFWRTFHLQLDDSREQQQAERKEDNAAPESSETSPPGAQPSAPDLPPAAPPPVEEDDPFAPKPAALSAGDVSTTTSSAPPPPSFLRGRLSRSQYMTVHKLWFKALHKLYDRSDAHVQAIKDWARDSWLSSATSHDTLDHPAFVDALFELVDIWTLTVEPSEYVHFLATLYHRVTRVKSWLADDSSLVTKYVWRKTKYVKPSAVYRPYQYHKYKDVRWKAASEVIHHLDSDDSSDEEEGEEREEAQLDDALIRDLQALSDEEVPSSPSTQSESSTSEEEEATLPLLSPSAPPPARTPLLAAAPAPIPRKMTAVPLPPLSIDPDRVLRRLSEVDVEPPKSPYLDPPAHIPLTPSSHHPSSSDDSDDDSARTRPSHRHRLSQLDPHPSSSSDEQSDSDALLSPTSLHQQARYNHAIDVLQQQREDRYVHLVTHLRTLLETTHRRLLRSNSVVQFTEQGTATRDVDEALKGSKVEMEDWEESHLLTASLQKRRLRRMSRTEPIGCLVDDDERYLRLRGDGRRRHSAPGDLAAFCCTGPRVYAEDAGPGSYEEPVRRSREAPRMETLDALMPTALEEERVEEAQPTVQPRVREARPMSSEMQQDDFAKYMAELTQQASPPSVTRQTTEPTQPPPVEATTPTSAALPSPEAHPRDRRPRPAPSAPVVAEPPSEATTAATANPVSDGLPRTPSQGKRKKGDGRPPSPVFAQSRRTSSVDAGRITPVARRQTKDGRPRAIEEEKKGTAAATASTPPKPSLPSPPATAPAAAASPHPVKEASPVEAAAAPVDSPDEISDVVHDLIARRRGTVKAAAKLIAVRDQRLANMGSANIRDEALAAEYDEEAGKRGSGASRSRLKALREVDDEEGRVDGDGEEEEGEQGAESLSEDDRLLASIRKRKEADARRAREEEERRRWREEEERRALEERMAALKAEKEIFSLLHEAETQRKVEAQLRQQKKDLVHKEKTSRRRKEREDSDKAAEAAALADEGMDAAQGRAEGEEAGESARPARPDHRASRGGGDQPRSRAASKAHPLANAESAKSEAIAEEEEVVAASTKGETAKRAADAKKNLAAAKRAATERKAKLDEEARARTEALKERQEAEAEAAKQNVPAKKLLKAKVVKKPSEEPTPSVAAEEEGEGRVRVRGDFMRSRKLDRSEVDGQQSPADGEAEEEEEAEEGRDGKEVKGGWKKEKEKRKELSEDAADSASASPSAVQSPTSQHSKGHKAAPTVSRRPRAPEASQEAEPSSATDAAAERRKQPKGAKEAKPRQPLAKDGNAEVEDNEESSPAAPLGGRFAKETVKKATASTADTAAASTELSSSASPLRSPKAPRSPSKRRAVRAAQKAAEAAESAELLAEEKEKFAFGADWSLEKKRAYREAEYAKEKEEEKAALVKSGENGLVELKWAQKVEELRRKEERRLKLEEQEKRMREIEERKKERTAERERERAAKAQQKLQANAQRAGAKLPPNALEQDEARQMASPRGRAAKVKQEAGDGASAMPSPKRRSGPLPAAAAKSAVSSPRPPRASLTTLHPSEEAVAANKATPASEPQPEPAAPVEPDAAPRPSMSNGPSEGRASIIQSTRPSITHRMPGMLRTSSYDVEPTVVESVSSSPVHRALVVAQPAASDPRKLAALKRREEAQRRVEEMKRQREERVQAQVEARRSAVASDDFQDAAEEDTQTPPVVEQGGDEGEERRVRAGARVDGAVALKEGEVKYWAAIGEDGLSSPRTEGAQAVKVVETGAADRLASPPQDIQRELALLRKPQRNWGMGLSNEDEGGDELQEGAERAGQSGASARGDRTEEEVQAWQSSQQRLRPTSATSAVALSLPETSVGEEGAVSIRHIHTSARQAAEPSPPRILESSHQPTFGQPHHLLPPPSTSSPHPEPSPSNTADLAASPRPSLDSSFVLSALHPAVPPPPDPEVPLTPVAARRVLRVEEEGRAMAALHEGTERGLSEAAARRWLLMEELMSEVKERGERWKQRRERLEGRSEAERVELRRRMEVEESGWEGRLRGLKEVSGALRAERVAAREARRRESQRRGEERAREAGELRAMREEALREKEARRRRKREEKGARQQARLQLQRQREEVVEERRESGGGQRRG